MNIAAAKRGERIIVRLGAVVSIIGPLILYWGTFTSKFGWGSDDYLTMGLAGCRPFQEVLSCFFHRGILIRYSPLPQLYSWVLVQIGGSSRAVQGAGGFVLHLAAVWALYHAAWRLSRSRVAGALTAVLWSSSTVHLHRFLSPIILCQECLMVCFLALSLTLLFSRQWKLTPLPMGLAMLTKEYAAMFPAILTAAWLVMLARAWEQKGRLRRTHYLSRGWIIATCWLIALLYVGLHVRYGSLRDVTAADVAGLMDPTRGGGSWTGSWTKAWTAFTWDNESILFRSFEFILWPALPGLSYPSVILRGTARPRSFFSRRSCCSLFCHWILLDSSGHGDR
jgi:hypothetical protein